MFIYWNKDKPGVVQQAMPGNFLTNGFQIIRVVDSNKFYYAQRTKVFNAALK